MRYIKTEGAPEAVGPYSQAVVHGQTLYCSGAIPLDPANGSLIDGSIAEETSQCLSNLKAVCEGAGSSMDCAIQLTVYTTQLERFPEINAAYAEFFQGRKFPARVTVGVAALPVGARVEISGIFAL